MSPRRGNEKWSRRCRKSTRFDASQGRSSWIGDVVPLILRGVGNAVIAAVGLLLPLVIACAVISTMMATRTSASGSSAVRTPNPVPAQRYLLSPADYLVYLDPSYAGSLGLWLMACGVVGGAYFLLAAIALPFGRSPRLGSAWWLFVVSLLVGCVMALPWWYAIVRRLIT